MLPGRGPGPASFGRCCLCLGLEPGPEDRESGPGLCRGLSWDFVSGRCPKRPTASLHAPQQGRKTTREWGSPTTGGGSPCVVVPVQNLGCDLSQEVLLQFEDAGRDVVQFRVPFKVQDAGMGPNNLQVVVRVQGQPMNVAVLLTGHATRSVAGTRTRRWIRTRVSVSGFGPRAKPRWLPVSLSGSSRSLSTSRATYSFWSESRPRPLGVV